MQPPNFSPPIARLLTTSNTADVNGNFQLADWQATYFPSGFIKSV
jgi:hypothetical protein